MSTTITYVVWSTLFTLATIAVSIAMFFVKNSWDPKGKHCYVTGGSSGLGLELSKILVQRGAHVSIVARDETKLKAALEELETQRQSSEQIIQYRSYSLIGAEDSEAALEAISKAHGEKSPDAIFLCAGAAQPRYFIEETTETLRKGLDNSYWIQALTAHAAIRRMTRRKEVGKVIFVGSVLSYFSMIGYSSYSPGKFALRGLAESLRSEMLLYGIDIHMFFPATIYSPGFENENKTKPEITLKIEERDPGFKPEVYAEELLKGLGRNEFHIAGDSISHYFRASTRGATPYNNVFTDLFYGFIGFVGIPDWRRGVDKMIKAYRPQHEKYLAEKNYFS